MVKPYSDMTDVDIDARIVELIGCLSELRELREELVYRACRKVEQGQHKGWWGHKYRAPVQKIIRELVRLGQWEWYSENEYYARRVEKDGKSC